MHFTMKKTYIAPQTNAIALNIESNILDASMRVSDETMTSNDFLSNKKRILFGVVNQKVLGANKLSAAHNNRAI